MIATNCQVKATMIDFVYQVLKRRYRPFSFIFQFKFLNFFSFIYRTLQSLCNACGIRFKKEERRATAAAATSANGATSSGSHSWMNNSQAQKMHCYAPSMNGNEFRFMEDHDMMTSHETADAAAAGIPFLSWRLNVTDRPSLVHDFTR